MKTPLGLVRMCTLPQGATNLMTHMQSAMNQILRNFVLDKTIFLWMIFLLKIAEREPKT
jgi:hypothetical protein